jgi:lipoprotein-releasing system ATP-binding protein
MNDAIVLECRSVGKSFLDGKDQLNVLTDINMQIKRGAQIAIMGRSGSGKSTLLQILGGLDNPSSGQVLINGVDVLALSETARAKWRNKAIGFIYQMHHLLSEFSALENIALPLLISGLSGKQALAQAMKLLQAVGLQNRSEHRPAQLSGGERQRIAIARSLAMHPECVLADEPTGNLDRENADLAFDLMQQLNRERGTTFIVVTHDPELAARLDQIYYLEDGILRS